ncbi:MAG: hypothetical protein Q8P40_01105, partial [Nitrospirota bacterium]|nr:hypothetical protein [Nitrospirota bacterium]
MNKPQQSNKPTSQIRRQKPVLLVSVFLLLSLIFSQFIFAAKLKTKNKTIVCIIKLKNGDYQLLVNSKPYIVKGVCYNPVPIVSNYEYDWWSDPNKPWLVDGKLMKEMGINTVRIYQTGEKPESVRQVIRDLFELYGIRVVLGHWLGFWEYPCPLYGDIEFQDRIKKDVLEMVALYKDEPGV